MARRPPEELTTIRRLSQSALRRVQRARSSALTEAELAGRAIVFAPHQDDETLGCGGTICKKISAGSEVTVVFMTDGSGSHPALPNTAELARIRKSEALAATAMLGVKASNVSFLDAPDGSLSEWSNVVVPKLIELISDFQPEQLFVPYSGDRLADHEATYSLVDTALTSISKRTAVYEYPVWFWNFWPFMMQPEGGIRNIPANWMRTIRMSTALVTQFNCHIDVSDVLDTKRGALELHATQMTKYDGSVDWPTLLDVANGDFVRNLTCSIEIFRRSAEA